MSLVSIAVDAAALERDLRTCMSGEVRFDAVSRALYSTDASVYQIMPLGVAVPRNREELVAAVKTAARHRCPVTLRGGGTSQAGQAIGAGLQIDISKHYCRLLEVNVAERWCRVEPGIVLDELNAALKEHSLRFAPDVSTASRATIGGMMANNSSGARSIYYGKTIDHVLEQTVLFADGSIRELRPYRGAELDAECAGDSIPAQGYRLVRQLGTELAGEVEARFPKVLRRVMGYNLDAFRDSSVCDLTRLLVGSEGTLGIVLEAKLRLVPLPKAKSVVTIQFSGLLDALGATPAILRHQPSAVEVMDAFILDHTRLNPALHRQRQTFIDGEPGALLCVEFYGESASELTPRMEELERDLRARGLGDRFYHATDAAAQSRIWGLREAALGLSMSMKDDNKSLSFVEDTAVAPEKLRDYIDRFLQLIRKHGTSAGIYAHASVGCLHVRPVVNMKTAEGIAKFQAIADDVADLVLEFGGALSGEHGDGMVRSPYIRKMLGDRIYEAFRAIKKTFDPDGILNPGKIVDSPPLTANLRYGTDYVTARPSTHFSYAEYGGFGNAVEMCSGLGACRKKLDGTMCPSYMATREEAHSTRGRANVLRLAMAGRLGEAGLHEDGVKEVLDLCLECRACKAECPVGVDMGRFKSEYLAARWERLGAPPLGARVLGNAAGLARWGSAFAPLSGAIANAAPVKWVTEKLTGIDARRPVPRWTRTTLRDRLPVREDASVYLFVDTFTNHYDPEIGLAAAGLLEKAGLRVSAASNVCCGRPFISQGLLTEAKELARQNTARLYAAASAGKPLVVCEPSCLSALRDDIPDLLRGDEQQRARVVGRSAVLLEEYLLDLPLTFGKGPEEIVWHGHCHQKSMGLGAPATALLAKVPGAKITALDSGCCGMAGSFGYVNYEVSRLIGERRLLPAARALQPGAVLVAAGTSCRHQVRDLAGVEAIHPAVLLHQLVRS
ncbi:MAG TPA: FAD-linked oxidase C-terminal domain-containing protein [Bryobacteraceae bacterium]|nr:FAD-linked oxidase C-terminal domain-containing protein [Bryobacteraceae bacterium]